MKKNETTLFSFSLTFGKFSARVSAAKASGSRGRGTPKMKKNAKKKLLGVAVLLAALGMSSCSLAQQDYQADERTTDYRDGQPSRVVEKNVRSSSVQGSVQVPLTR